MKLFLPIVLLHFLALTCLSQQLTDPSLWHNIERSLRTKKNLDASRSRLIQLKEEATKTHDQASLARAYCYLMLLQDGRTEDTLYFRNSAFIDSIIHFTTDTELKGFMHYLQAQRLWKFRSKDLRFNRAKYETKDLPINYAAFSMKDLDSTINFHFDKSKQICFYLHEKKSEPPLGKMLWLSSTPLTFLFKPSLIDIIYLEQICYNRSAKSFLFINGKRARQWLNLSPTDFIDTLGRLDYGKEKGAEMLSLYSSWLTKSRHQPSAYYSIELLARQYVYDELDSEHDIPLQKIWDTYLTTLSGSNYAEVKAKSIFARCFLYKSWAEKYPSQQGYYDRDPDKHYDTSFQYYNVKALELYERNKDLFEAFGNLKERLNNLQQLRDPSLLIKMNGENETAKPVLLRVEYKNVPKLYYRIVRLNLEEKVDNKILPETGLLKKAVFKQDVVTLPLPADYNLHRTFFKLEALPAGRYYLLFSYDSTFKANRISYLQFFITGLAVLHTDDRVYIVNRTTGMPVQNAKIDASYSVEKTYDKTKFNNTVHQYYATNAKGYITLPKKEDYKLMVTYKGDSLVESVDTEKDVVSEDVFNKEDYDDLIDYYDENTSVEIFTDRAIYRPGQKVFFKVLFITKDPRTGSGQIMNKNHLKKGFRNWLKKWVNEMEPMLYLHDPFMRVMDSLKINLDEYGTVSGTFTVPKNGATGAWSIAPDYLDTHGDNSGIFNVEEYKRPTFEISIDKPEKTFRIGDTILFAVKLKSFAGSNVGHSLVEYSVERSNTSKIDYTDGGYKERVDIADTSAYTDEHGTLVIKLVDTSLGNIDKEQDIVFTYRLTASVTDASGETHAAKSSLKIATRPVVIRIPAYGNNNINELRPLLINAKDVNGLEINRILRVKLFQFSFPPKNYEKDYSKYADQWIYNPADLSTWFDEVKFTSGGKSENEELLFETKINTMNADKFRWPMDKIIAGKYRIEVESIEEGIITGKASQVITIFEPGSPRLPTDKKFFFHLGANYVRKGDTLHLFSGSNVDNTYSIIQLKYYSIKNGKKIITNSFFESEKQKGVHAWKWKIPDNVVDRLLISEIFVANNEVYFKEEDVDIEMKKVQPQIIIEQFRNSLTPGAKSTYSVSIKTKQQHIAAQLMTGIYDASLDKLAEHRWGIPYPERSANLNNEWTNHISDEVSEIANYLQPRLETTLHVKPVWWIDATGLTGAASSIRIQNQTVENPLLALQGQVPGLMITNATGMDEMMVIGYGTTTQRLHTGNVTTIKTQGINSIRLDAYKQPLIILDGAPFTGELSSINIKEVTEIMVLKDANATAIYGSRAAGGVLLISTKGEIKLPAVKQEPVLKVRDNFNETAFFAPAIYADRDGFYKFTFTIPESLTEWNWKLLAHTKNMKFAYAERKLVTQLPLMIQPHLPTIIYQGDRIILKSRIANLDTMQITGNAECKIEDAETGENLTAKMVMQPAVGFKVDAKSNGVASFELKIPDGHLHPIKILLTAKTNDFADGEAHILPVLSKAILVKQNQQVFLQKDTTVFKPASINRVYGIELSIQPKPHAALINSLPFLANYSYDCAEQIFNKMYAHVIASILMRKDTALQNLYHKIAAMKKQAMVQPPISIARQTMPWLNLNNKTVKEQTDLLLMLDTLKGRERIKDYLSRLMSLQKENGGISWFPGGSTNPQISMYILERFGKMMQNESLYPVSNLYVGDNFENFINKLIRYCDHELLLLDKESSDRLPYYANARSFWKVKYPLKGNLESKIKSLLNKNWEIENKSTLKEQAMLCLASFRYFDKSDTSYSKAIAHIHSIKQQAIQDEENGIRWKELADADDIGSSSEETISYLLEAFTEAGEADTIEPGVIKWLLNSKADHQWKTTTGTAAIIAVLLKKKVPVTTGDNVVKAIFQDTTISVSDGLLSGRRSAFRQIKELQSLSLKAVSQPLAANIGWYYFTNSDSLNKFNQDVHLSKTISRFNENTKEWEPVKDTTRLNLGEKMKITLVFETKRALRYVFIEDKKAAAFEPLVYNSGYVRGIDFSYYESTRDAGRQFFAEYIPSGRTQIIYEMVAAQEGTFSSGLATLECMYHPEISVYSNQQGIHVGN